MKRISYLFLIALVLGLSYCSTKKEMKATISSEPFGVLPSGEEVTKYSLTNSEGITMDVINYGGIITSLGIPDKNGVVEDIVLGYDNLDSYLEATPYFGAIVGRYGNRIAEGRFSLDGETYELAQNNGVNHLHGGPIGFDKVNWNAETFEKEEGIGIRFKRTSPDMEEGYPGNLETTVTYFLGNDNTLEFDYEAETDKKTIVNLTQHTYFNFTALDEDILNHELMLNAFAFLPVDSTLIPTGELKNVVGTPFDFSKPKPIGRDINKDNQQLAYGGGYDHNWVLNATKDDMNLAATLYEPVSGRYMEVFTTEPGIQFYSGNFLDGTNVGKGKTPYNFRTGLCLETQHYPDSPNQSNFPSVVLEPGKTYKTTTLLKFSTK